jgi:hydrogenase expression/formation protein HypC
MQILGVDGFNARVAAKGVERDISLFMLQDDQPAIGDFVIVHLGYATQKISAEDARSSWELFDQILAASDA